MASSAPFQEVRRHPRRATFDAVFDALIQQESSGRPGIEGPQTRYGRALGMTQMLPATAREMAQRLRLPYREDLLRGATPQAVQYQRALGRAYLEEAYRETGNWRDALMYYHGGPNRRLWGPKTRRHAERVLGRIGRGS